MSRAVDREALFELAEALRGGTTARVVVDVGPGHARSVTVHADVLARALADVLARDP